MSLKINFKKLIIIYIISIFLINSIAYTLILGGIKPFSDLTEDMILIKIKPLKYAIVFAHGVYETHFYPNRTNCTYSVTRHFTILNSTKAIPTIALLNDLKKEGYKKVWLSQCYTGDSDYMTYYINQTNFEIYNRTEWYDWVSRNKRPGDTYPIFIGFGFIRLSL